MAEYSIGLDFGTLSGRALLVNMKTGQEVASAVYDYPHGVMDSSLPCGVKLKQDWALQDPQDYLDVLKNTIPEVLKKAGVAAAEVRGVGVDFTSCTILPVSEDGTPLCFYEKYKNEPHAYVKLWKHHAAQELAEKMTAAASERGEKWLGNYGGKISSEWAFPKIWQVLREAPQVYNDAFRFVEAADWITRVLTGTETHSACCAGYKTLWNKKTGFPSKEYFKSLDPALENVAEEKICGNILPLGATAGTVNARGAELTGLCTGTPVAVAVIDAHSFVPGAGICSEGEMLAIMGTSTCHMMVSKREIQVKGICGVTQDGILPGFYGYEAGQCCVGDHFSWFTDNCLPAEYYCDAQKQGMNIHGYLRKKCEDKKPGESGLLALDWWNGNRSVLVDSDLTGLILGMTLRTKPEDIYRALIEATAYGTRMIVENFRSFGIEVSSFVAAGGISQKDPMTMQIYTDVLGMPVKIAGSSQCGALGAAVFGAVAAGSANGGYDDVLEASSKMGKLKDTVYYPVTENTEIYNRLYKEYKILHDYFGKGGNDVMKRLKQIKENY